MRLSANPDAGLWPPPPRGSRAPRSCTEGGGLEECGRYGGGGACEGRAGTGTRGEPARRPPRKEPAGEVCAWGAGSLPRLRGEPWGPTGEVLAGAGAGVWGSRCWSRGHRQDRGRHPRDRIGHPGARVVTLGIEGHPRGPGLSLGAGIIIRGWRSLSVSGSLSRVRSQGGRSGSGLSLRLGSLRLGSLASLSPGNF